MPGYSVRNGRMEMLMRAVVDISSVDEAYRFFEDICTIRELETISQRLEVARLLKAHDTYGAIAEATGASTATIVRVNRALRYGSGGYDSVMRSLAAGETSGTPSDRRECGDAEK